jgi:hypothetical protein
VPTILDSPTRIQTTLLEDPASNLDFSRFSAYFDSLGVLYLPGQGKQTRTLPVEPPRTDTGTSEFEIRPDFGSFFGQGDFSGGGLQRYFHRSSSDKTAYLESEGFDISVPGELRHLNSVLETDAETFSSATSLEEAADLPFLAHGTSVYAGTGSFPGTWTAEDPSGASEAAATVLDMTSRGDELFAALGAAGVHIRSSAGVWTHFQPDGATDLDTGTTTKVSFLKDRLFVVGAAGRSIYEVVADSTPTALETLPEGWTFEGIFESGPFVFATAVCPTAGLSRVHAYGLVSDVMAKKTSTALPKGDLAYSGIGYLGRVFIGGGRQTSAGGLDPLLYEGIPDENGALQLLLVAADDEGGAEDLAVRCFSSFGEGIVFGWSRSNEEGNLRVGLGSYGLARNAFSFHLRDGAASSAEGVDDVIRYRGRLLFTAGGSLFHEELDAPVPEATLISSLGDWNNVGFKTWDLFQVAHDTLVVNSSVELEYTTKDPDLDEWQDALTSALPGAVGAEQRLEDVKARQLSVRIISTAGASQAPVIRSFSVRSVPAPEETEWLLIRTVRLVDKDRKDRRAEAIHRKVRETRAALQDLAHTWVTLYEPGVTWTAYVQEVGEVEPAEAPSSATGGTEAREGFYVELRMVARRA